MDVIDTLLGIVLIGGVALSLPIWWWLFVEPIVPGCKRLLGRRSLSSLEQEAGGAHLEVPHADGEKESHAVRILYT
jgi:hypothetical protein